MAPSQHILVLLVEDEPLVRLIACDGLEDAGFDVLEAKDSQEALDILRSRSDIGVLFTDVNMPGKLDGMALAELVHHKWPDIKLVVTSGRVLPRPVPDDGRFLPKPYSLQKLTNLVEEVSLPQAGVTPRG
jgi:CheY-like chemotaxis protein